MANPPSDPSTPSTSPSGWASRRSHGPRSSGLRSEHHVTGALVGPSGAEIECEVLACDLAYPAPVLEEKWRGAAHRAWQSEETLLLEYDGRLTLVVPGTSVGVEDALEAIRRLAKAVDAPSTGSPSPSASECLLRFPRDVGAVTPHGSHLVVNDSSPWGAGHREPENRAPTGWAFEVYGEQLTCRTRRNETPTGIVTDHGV